VRKKNIERKKGKIGFIRLPYVIWSEIFVILGVSLLKVVNFSKMPGCVCV